MITVFADNKEIPINMVEFSDGALTFKLDKLPETPRYISVNICPTTPVYRIREEIRLVVSCIENFYGCVMLQGQKFSTILNLPYLGYGRADRVFEKGNPSPLYDFLQDLNAFGFTEVLCSDIHNKDCLYIGSVPNITEKSQLECFKQSLPQDFNTDYDIILAPDKGAVDKAASIADHLEVDVYNCGKERDISTGKVIKTVLPPDVDFTGKVVLIPDDLMDGGYSFIRLAEQLKTAGAKQVDLYVTHLIASKGLDVLKGLVDNVYCYQVVGKYVNKLDVTHFNLNK